MCVYIIYMHIYIYISIYLYQVPFGYHLLLFSITIDPITARSHQLPIVPYVGIWLFDHLPSPYWNFYLAWACARTLFAVTTTMNSYVQLSICVASGKHCFAVSITASGSYCCPSFFKDDPWALGDRMWCPCPNLGLGIPVSYSLRLSQLWVSVFMTIYWK